MVANLGVKSDESPCDLRRMQLLSMKQNVLVDARTQYLYHILKSHLFEKYELLSYESFKHLSL